MSYVDVFKLANLNKIILEYNLKNNELVDISIGNDNQIYILFAEKVPDRINGMFVQTKTDTAWTALVLNLDWQTGELYYCRKIEFGRQKINFHFIQPIGEYYLLLGARTMRYKKGFDCNASIVDEYGNILKAFV